MNNNFVITSPLSVTFQGQSRTGEPQIFHDENSGVLVLTVGFSTASDNIGNFLNGHAVAKLRLECQGGGLAESDSYTFDSASGATFTVPYKTRSFLEGEWPIDLSLKLFPAKKARVFFDLGGSHADKTTYDLGNVHVMLP